MVVLRAGSANDLRTDTNVLRIVTPNALAWLREWDDLRQALAA